MTVGELKAYLTSSCSDEDEVEVYVAYEAVLTASGKGNKERGYIVKDIEHVATKAVEGMVILTTSPTTNKAIIQAGKEKAHSLVINH